MSNLMSRIVRGPLALVLAISLIAVGASSLVKSNTVAFFTATTVNANNSFSSEQIIFNNTPNGGTLCTAGPGTTNNPTSPACSALVTLANIVPGDTKLGKITLNTPASPTGNAEAPVTVWLGVTASSSSALDTTGLTSGGLGLLLFTCYSGSSTPPTTVSTIADCETAPGAGNSLYLLPTYPVPSSTPCGTLTGPTAKDSTGTARATFQLAANTALGTALISTPNSLANEQVLIAGASNTTATCVGDNMVTPSISGQKEVPIGGPSAVTGVQSTGGSVQTQGLAAGDTDYLAAIAYLPTVAGNALQNLSSTLSFTWTAEQKAGTSS